MAKAQSARRFIVMTRLCGIGQPLGCVLAQGLQQPVAVCCRVVADQGTINQTEHAVDNVQRVVATSDSLGSS